MTKKESKRSAIVIGGTGGVGAYLVEKLLASPDYSKVTVISRKEIPKSPNLYNIVWTDFSKYLLDMKDETVELFKNHDVLFCCLGASEKAMMGLLFNKKKYGKLFRTTDYDYTVGAASHAFKADIPQFSVISSPTANPNARFLYSKIKGEMELAVKALAFDKLSIFHPYSLMKPAKKNEPFPKKALKHLIAFFSLLIPAKQRAISVEDVAKAMKLEFELKRKGDKTITYYTSNDMREIIKNNHDNN